MNNLLQRLSLLTVATTLLAVNAATVSAQTTWVVTSTADDGGPDTLRYAIGGARDADTIVIDPSLSGMTITLATHELEIAASVNIIGPEGGLTIDGFGFLRVLEIDYSANVTMSGMTFTRGGGWRSAYPQAWLPEEAYRGGAILNNGALTLIDCVISNSRSGGYYGGGICNYGALAMQGCTVTGNDAVVIGSGSLGSGGGIANFADAVLDGCTISDNIASYAGGGVFNIGTMTISNSTISGNAAGWAGGGIFNKKGADLTLLYSTVTGNTPDNVSGHVQQKGSTISKTH